MASINSTSTSTSYNRLTGLATGLDIDSMVKAQMKAYQTKVDSVTQQKNIIEIKQKLYRDILNDTRNFYNKYLDPLSKDSLIMSSAYTSVKFTSSDDSIVSVTSNAEAKVDSYTITGYVATAKQAKFYGDIKSDEKIIINGKEFTMKGETPTEIAKNLNNDLKIAGLSVQVKYTKLAGTESTDSTNNNKDALIIESTVLGGKSELEVNGNISIGTTIQGTDATKATLTGISINDIKKESGKISIGSDTVQLDTSKTDDEIISELKNKLSNNDYNEINVDKYGNITFTAKESGSNIKNPNIQVGDNKGTFKAGLDAKSTITTIGKTELKDLKSIIINGELISSINDKNLSELSDTEWNSILNSKGISVKVENENIVFTATKAGKDQNVNVYLPSGKESIGVTGGEDARIIIKNSSGGVYTHTGDSNTVTLDGVIFKFNGTLRITEEKAIKITGKVDVTSTKDKIVKFINDYNTLMEKLNKSINTKHNRDYKPLTSDQKAAMSDKEIELWNTKVEEGQLYKDSDLTRITNALKESMRSVISGTGLSLEAIGINPVKDYTGNKNGTFSIDETKLTSALEDNMDSIIDLLIKYPPKELTGNEKKDPLKLAEYNKAYEQSGIFYKLKDILNSEVMKSNSILSKKVGIEGTSTFTNNTLTKNISDYETKISEMKTEMARREQLLYSKYANLETIMNNYNSQQSYLLSYLGN